MNICKPRMREPEIEGSWVQGQPGNMAKIYLKKKNTLHKCLWENQHQSLPCHLA